MLVMNSTEPILERALLNPQPNTNEYYDAIKIFVAICEFLDPYDLLKLECVCKKFKDYLRSKDSEAIELLWKHSRNTYTPFNDYEVLTGMSERDYTKLLCIKNGCQRCGRGRNNIYNNTYNSDNVCVYFIPKEQKFIEQIPNVRKETLKAIPTVSHKDPLGKGEKQYWISTYFKVDQILSKLSAREKIEFLMDKEDESKFLIEEDRKQTDELILQLATRLSENSNLYTFFDEYQHSSYMANDESDLLMIGMNLQYT
nr:2331_t:CDS:2 [Entrophospora candida]CAG8474649.1 6012_t:CDS:2 [Entrophospora candida]